MIFPGHHGSSPEPLDAPKDPIVIRRHNHILEVFRLLRAFPDMLDDRLTAEIEQDLAGQTRGSDASGNAEGDGGHGLGKNRGLNR